MTTYPRANPTDELMQEHQSVLRLLHEMNKVITTAEPSNVPPWKAFLEKALRYFSTEVASHFKKEEEALFPAMEKYIGRETGPIAVMRHEHQQHNSFLLQLEKAVEAGDLGGILEVWESFNPLLTMHIAKEDSVLFPMAERMLSESEKNEVAQKMECIKRAA